MKLKSKLPRGGDIFISLADGQTHISLSNNDSNSSQSQAASFSTGEWKGQPSLFKTSDGLVLQLEAEQGSFALGIKNSSIQQLDNPPSTQGDEKLKLEEAGPDEGPQPMEPMKPMQGMEPMKPMKPMN